MHSKRTLKTIEWSLAGITMAGGIYNAVDQILQGPSPTGTLIVTLLQGDFSGLIWSGMLIIGSILVMLGLKTESPSMKRHGWLLLAMARLFQVSGVMLISGFFPMSWLYPATILVIMCILYYHNSLDRYVDTKPNEMPPVQ